MLILLCLVCFAFVNSQEAEKQCNFPGKNLITQDFNISLDKLHELLFTDSEWYRNFQKERGNLNLNITEWKNDMRVVTYSTPLGLNFIGPAVAKITEIQKNRPTTSEPKKYIIDIATVTKGVPFADAFFHLQHTCLLQLNATASKMIVTGELRFKQPLIIRELIANTVDEGLTSYFDELKKKLNEYKEE